MRLAALYYRVAYRSFLADCRGRGGVFEVRLRDGRVVRGVRDFDPAPLGQDFERLRPPPGGVVMDLGGNIGATAVYLAQTVGPAGRVIVYEPDEDNLRVLRANLELNGQPRVDVVPLGLWNKEDTLTFHAGGGYTSSFQPTNYIAAEPARYRTLRVPVTTVDREVERLGLPRLDLIKIDIEGSEVQALEGARETLRRFRPDLVVECHTVEGQSTEAAVLRLLREAGYAPESHAVRGEEPVIEARGEPGGAA